MEHPDSYSTEWQAQWGQVSWEASPPEMPPATQPPSGYTPRYREHSEFPPDFQEITNENHSQPIEGEVLFFHKNYQPTSHQRNKHLDQFVLRDANGTYFVYQAAINAEGRALLQNAANASAKRRDPNQQNYGSDLVEASQVRLNFQEGRMRIQPTHQQQQQAGRGWGF